MMRGDLFITDPNGVSFQLSVKQGGEDLASDTDSAARAEQMVKEWVAERTAQSAAPTT